MKNNNFMIIGGDNRFAYMENFFYDKGIKVKRIYPGEYKADDFSAFGNFILPVPASRDNININTPISEETLYFGDFFRLLPNGCRLAGGMIPEEWKKKLDEKDIEVFDYYGDTDFAADNAIPTAEGVIGIIINRLPVTVNELNCIVTGYGKCGKVIAERLMMLGAKVTVAARRDESIKDAESNGLNAVSLSEIGKVSQHARVLINTVPSRIIDEAVISRLKNDSIIIEIASAPFGTDFDCAARYGITVIKAGALPSRFSPETAGKIIAKTIIKHYGGELNGD